VFVLVKNGIDDGNGGRIRDEEVGRRKVGTFI